MLERWREYNQKLMNEENQIDRRNEQQVEVEGDIREITSADIEMALRNMNNGKASGLDNLPAEVWKSLGRTGVNFLTFTFKQAILNGAAKFIPHKTVRSTNTNL